MSILPAGKKGLKRSKKLRKALQLKYRKNAGTSEGIVHNAKILLMRGHSPKAAAHKAAQMATRAGHRALYPRAGLLQ